MPPPPPPLPEHMCGVCHLLGAGIDLRPERTALLEVLLGLEPVLLQPLLVPLVRNQLVDLRRQQRAAWRTESQFPEARRDAPNSQQPGQQPWPARKICPPWSGGLSQGNSGQGNSGQATVVRATEGCAAGPLTDDAAVASPLRVMVGLYLNCE